MKQRAEEIRARVSARLCERSERKKGVFFEKEQVVWFSVLKNEREFF